MKKIAVIGAGSTGHALAAILASKGHTVYLADTEVYADILQETRNAGIIHVSGAVTLEGTPAVITTDIGRAVTDAELIVCCTVSNRDAEVAHILTPYLTTEKAVLISAGNGASVIYHRIFAQASLSDVVVGEVAGNFFPCRLTGPGQTVIGLPLSPKGAAAFPTKNTRKLIEAFDEVWELTPCRSLFEAMFNGPNLICHGAGIVTNLVAIDRSNGGFNLFTDGLSPAYLDLTDALWEEKRSVYEAMECTVSPPPRGMLAGVWDVANSQYDHFRKMDGPGSLSNRYITEDVPCLLCYFVSIARHLNVPVPLFEGIVSTLSAATKTDFYANGRTLENLGLDNLSREELIRFFLVEV